MATTGRQYIEDAIELGARSTASGKERELKVNPERLDLDLFRSINLWRPVMGRGGSFDFAGRLGRRDQADIYR